MGAGAGVIAGCRPTWKEVTLLLWATKGLWSTFDALRLCDGMLQRGWKGPATGETRWKVVVLKARRRAILQAVHGPQGLVTLECPRHFTASGKNFIGANRGDVVDYCHRCDSSQGSDRCHAHLPQFLVGVSGTICHSSRGMSLHLSQRRSRHLHTSTRVYTSNSLGYIYVNVVKLQMMVRGK